MRRVAFLFVFLLVGSGSARADTRTSPLTRGLADALYLKLGGGTLTGALTVTDITISGTCTGCSTGSVPTSRTISTTSPLAGGGALSSNLTLTCATCATSSNNLSFFSATSSAQLLGLISDETGTGLLVFGTSPVLTTPTIADFTNATHAHTSAATGGSLSGSAISSGQVAAARGGTNADSSGSTGVAQVAAGVWSFSQVLSNITSLGISRTAAANTLIDAQVTSASTQSWRLDNPSTTGGASVLVRSGNGTTSGEIATFEAYSSEAVPQYYQWGMIASKHWKLYDSTASLLAIDVTNGTAAVAFGGAITPTQTGGIVGTTTNNNASAGSFGEFTNAQCPGPTTTATITVTIASPGVVTWTSHPFNGTAPRFDACPVVFTTGGALPTGITASTTYWVVPTTISGNNFSIATSVANAIAGTSINTSGTQSGTHTGTAGSVLTTATAKDVMGLALTAGDWDCSALLARGLGGTTSVTLLKTSISTTSATDGTIPAGTMNQYAQAASVPANDVDESIGPLRLLNSATTNTFLVADDTFTLSTNKAYGTIRCRRMR